MSNRSIMQTLKVGEISIHTYPVPDTRHFQFMIAYYVGKQVRNEFGTGKYSGHVEATNAAYDWLSANKEQTGYLSSRA